MDDRRKKGEFVGALGALLVHVAVIALLILVSFTVPQPDEDAGGVPVMLGNVESARGFDDPSLVDVDILPEEGRVVVNITVNPAGVVIGTSINPQTNTVNSTLRKAAEDAAKKARFNTVEGPNNQTGTITYYFNLR